MTDTASTARIVSVPEAAEHLGISTLRVRHRLRTGLLKGFRDNRGHWQVHLDGQSSPAPDRPLDGDALTDMLVEELLEAKDRIDDQEQAINRLLAIIERQQKVLERAIARFEAPPPAQPEAETSTRVRGLLERLLGLLETSIAQNEAADTRTERFRAVLARAVDLLEKIEPGARAAEQRTDKLGDKLAAAIDLGERAIARAEASTHHAAQLDNMLERALVAAERNAERQQQTEQRLKARDELLERSLSLIESVSSRVSGRSAMRRRWFALFGWREPRASGE